MQESASYLGLYFPWTLFIALLIAIVFAALGVIIFKRGMKKAAKPAEPNVEDIVPSAWMLTVREFLARYGYFPTDALSKSFVQALRVLQSFIGGYEFRYQLPWYMVIGEENSGKSSLLNSLDINLPVGRPHFGNDGEVQADCDWWFYDHGVVLDISGKLVLEEGTITSDEAKWDSLLNLLSHHRPKRPLDGLVVTISSADLIGDGKLNYDDLRLRAEYIYMKMWQLQRKTGLRLPVYITVTKCDTIPGFQTLCQSLPKGREKEIFGWSNESALDTIYEPQWVSDAFQSIRLNLYRIQQNIFAGGRTYTNLDGIFRFPFEFVQMKENLQTYINHIFKASGYHEGFYLRGIYFTGDSGSGSTPQSDALASSEKREKELQALLEVQGSVLGDYAEKPDSHSPDLKSNIYFINDLFEKRVFREVGIARPISTVLLGNTSAMRAAKVGVASGSVIATLGLLNAADNLSNSANSIEPALAQIDQSLAAIQGKDPTKEQGPYLFEQQATMLLDTMSKMQANDLSSVFIPASWFSSVNEDITNVMAVAFDQVIFQSMSTQLTYRANDLVNLSSPVDVTQIPSKDGDPLKTTQFYRVFNYVTQIYALGIIAEKYNNIGITTDLKEVSEIIEYLFGTKLPASFLENDIYYKRALATTKVKIFDEREYQSYAIKKLRKLFDEFQLVAFNPDVVIPGVGALSRGLDNLKDNRNISTYDAQNLRNIKTALATTIESLNSPVVSWIDTDIFSPGLAYEHMMSFISGSPLLGAEVSGEIYEEAKGNFEKFKDRLKAYSSPLMDGPLLQHEGDKVMANPTAGATKLMSALNLFYSQNFMTEAKDTQLIVDVPPGSVLMWDSLRLNQASDLIKNFGEFVNSKLLTFPKMLQPLLQKVAAESLTANLTQIITDAEVFQTQLPPSYSSSPEEALLSQVQNYRASADNLEKILFTLQSNQANDTYTGLRGLVIKQNYDLLTALDNILEDEGPYAIKDGGFSWWQGQNLAGVEAFGVSNLVELKGYLDLQRERIRYLAMEFASPVVNFLQVVNKQAMPGNMPLVTKWGNIIQELDGYNKKTKGNGLIELENFIETPLNEVTVSTCTKYVPSVAPLTEQNSFFVSILDNIQIGVINRCDQLAGSVSSNTYSYLSDYFNANLSGKFPFNDPTQKGEVVEADPEDIRGFFDLMDEKASTIKTTLEQSTGILGAAGTRALNFIESMDAIRKFFGGYLTAGSKMPYPQFDFTVDFRVNRTAEKSANQIVDWYVNVQDTKVDFRSKDTAGHWNMGNPIAVGLRWAANSPDQPQSGSTNTALNVVNGTALFNYSGKWGLVHLLKDQAAPLSDFANLKDNQPQTLAFEVPLKDVLSSGSTPAQTAKVFIRFQVKPILESVDPKTGAVTYKPGGAVTLPTFPVSAPKLSGA